MKIALISSQTISIILNKLTYRIASENSIRPMKQSNNSFVLILTEKYLIVAEN